MAQSGTLATHGNVHELAAELRLDHAAFERAREIAGLTPDRDDWLRYVDHFLIAVGALLVVAGVTAFFAWNWADLNHLAKFALIQGGIAGTAAMSWRLGLDSIGGRASLFVSAFLVGVLLAVFGQVYQTGADPYGLFLGWAVLILPWVIIGRQAGLWMLLQILLLIGVMMFWTQVLFPPDGWWQLAQLLGPMAWLGATVMDDKLGSLVFLASATALFAWEYAANHGADWLQGRVFPRITAFGALTTVLVPTVIAIFAASLDTSYNASALAPVLYTAGSAFCLWYYQYRKFDLFILTLCVFGAIMVVMSFCTRFLFNDISSALLLAILLIGQVAGAAYWLRNVARQWEAAS